MNKVIFNMGS